MKLLIEPPTWLGDTVMASGSVKALLDELKPEKAIVFGSFVATELLKEWFDEAIVIDKKHKFRQFKNFPKADVFISFRTSLYSKILGLKAKKSFYFDKNLSGHMVEKYSKYVNTIIGKNEVYSPVLPFEPKHFQKPALGINPGAAYGSAKRWYPEEFAKVANALGEKYDVIIFGGVLPNLKDGQHADKSAELRNTINISQKDRIKMALIFNEELKKLVNKYKLKYIEIIKNTLIQNQELLKMNL